MNTHYIYFVKCPGCEDERFEFFDAAKECALSCLSKKPVITQTEYYNNGSGFGECTGSSDLDVVWSWEDMMQDMPSDSGLTTFSKAETVDCDDDYFNCEFDSLDDSLDNVPDNFRRPVPADMTIDGLVEAMEENEDTVECKKCNELFDKKSCTKDPKLGWVCEGCRKSTITESVNTYTCWFDGKELGTVDATCEEEAYGKMEHTWPELNYSLYDGVATVEPLTEAIHPVDTVELHYDSLTTDIVTKYIPATYEDPAEEVEGEYTDEFDFQVDTTSVEEALLNDLMTAADVASVPGGFDALMDKATCDAFFKANLDALVDKYYDQLLEYFRDAAMEAAKETFQQHYEDRLEADRERWDENRYDECLTTKKEVLSEEDDPDSDDSLVACPECGVDESFNYRTGTCINCGFNLR